MDNGSESEDEVLDLLDPDAGIPPDSVSEGQQSDLSSGNDVNVDPRLCSQVQVELTVTTTSSPSPSPSPPSSPVPKYKMHAFGHEHLLS